MSLSPLRAIRRGGGLTSVEASTLQQVADESGLPFSVVGERGRHAGRHIDSDLPFGQEPGQRSFIEFAFPSEYDLLTAGGFTERLYSSLDSLFGRGNRGYRQASHLWPPKEPSIDFYPHDGRRVILTAQPKPGIVRVPSGSN